MRTERGFEVMPSSDVYGSARFSMDVAEMDCFEVKQMCDTRVNGFLGCDMNGGATKGGNGVTRSTQRFLG